jgi:hypothetical protein
VRGIREAAGRLVPVICAYMGLSGCVAAAVPLMMGASVGVAALSGFELYKVVQLEGGGSARIEFPGKDGKTAPPQPLPAFRRAAVWPGDEGDVRFAERLQSSARFSSVVAPAAVSAILADTKTAVDLKQLYDAMRVGEQLCAFFCREIASLSGGALKSSYSGRYRFELVPLVSGSKALAQYRQAIVDGLVGYTGFNCLCFISLYVTRRNLSDGHLPEVRNERRRKNILLGFLLRILVVRYNILVKPLPGELSKQQLLKCGLRCSDHFLTACQFLPKRRLVG